MTFVRPKARILERSITPGSGPFALGGAVDASYNSFASFMSVGDETYGYVVEPGVAFWTGIVTYSAADQITLTTMEESKGGFGAGTKEIGCGPLASTSMFREDIAGAIVTGGTSTAYTVSSYRKYDSLTRLDGNIMAFTPHITNGANGTSLNIDGLGPKPVLLSPGVGLIEGVLIQGTPYVVTYSSTNDAFYLHNGFNGNPYNVPLAGGLDYWGVTPPNSAFAFPVGQAISRSSYAALFALVGTRFGAGDGSTTFNLPDKRDRVSVMMGSAARIAPAYMTPAVGAAGGTQDTTLQVANLPPFTPSGSITNGQVEIGGSSTLTVGQENGAQYALNAGANVGARNVTLSISQLASTFHGDAQGGSSAAFVNLQPSIFCSYIMRVL